MREEYFEYIKEHPEELASVVALIKRSKEIQADRDERAKARVALIQKSREELYETRNRRN